MNIAQSSDRCTSYNGHGARFEVDASSITKVNGAAVGAAFGTGARIALPSVIGVNFKPATLLVNGYLQVVVAGIAPAKAAAGDPTTVVFTRKTQVQFEQLRDWLQHVAEINRAQRPQASTTPTPTPAVGSHPVRASTSRTPSSTPLVTDVEIAGESYHQESFARLFRTAAKPLGGLIWRDAELVPEPKNPYDRHAVAVHIGGLVVGHVPAEMAPEVQPKVIRANKSHTHVIVAARVWAIFEHGKWSARVTLEPSEEHEPEWSYVDQPQWPGRFSPDRTERLTDESLLRQIAAADAARLVNGRDFETLRPDIAQARTDGDFDRAQALLNECICAAERGAAVTFTRPTAWPTEQAAIVYRSLKDYDAEVAVIERYLRADPDHAGTKGLQARLRRARELAGHEVPAQDIPRKPAVREHQADAILADALPTVEVTLPDPAELAYEGDFTDTIAALLQRAHVPDGQAMHTTAVVRENPHSPRGRGVIATYIDGELMGFVGALDSDIVRDVIRRDEYVGFDCAIQCRVYMPDNARAQARITLGPYESAIANEDETESAARDRQTAKEQALLRESRLAAGGEEAEDQRRRLVRGKDFTEWVEPIKALKRSKRYEEALELILECVDTAERDARYHEYAPPPWYTEQAAIIYRQTGSIAAEVSILDRFQRACPSGKSSPSIAERLVKARAKLR
ncbi:hypothetical protein ACWDTI_05025 [Gordonia sp. NPDC003424]